MVSSLLFSGHGIGFATYAVLQVGSSALVDAVVLACGSRLTAGGLAFSAAR